jgi:hypothetical protein
MLLRVACNNIQQTDYERLLTFGLPGGFQVIVERRPDFAADRTTEAHLGM